MGASFLQIMLAFSKKLVYTVFVSAEFVAVTQFPTPAGVMGSAPTTASGGVTEGERVAAVDEGRRLFKAEDIRRVPQQGERHTVSRLKSAICPGRLPHCPWSVQKMASANAEAIFVRNAQ